MRILPAAVGAALVLLIASPVLAGDRGGGRGGHHPQPPRPPAPCCHGGGGGGGGNTNVNVNVNASAQAYASAGAASHFNARAYNVGSYRGGSGGGGTVYVGSGGYGGDIGGYAGGPAIYGDLDAVGPACPSAPFGYIVTGFGRNEHRPSRCGYRYEDAGHDRGGRYGYSERHESYGESRYEVRESYEEYEAAAYYEERDHYRDAREDRREYDRRDCDCRADREPVPYAAPYVEPRPAPPEDLGYYGDLPPPGHVAPQAPPHGGYPYRQEPGERG